VPGCELLNNTNHLINFQINTVRIFPNPTINQIYFQFEQPLENAIIRVFNPLGKFIIQKNMVDSQIEIEVANWQKSVYYCGVCKDKQLVKQGTFIKQ
jgi:hypothetical protein